MVNTIDVDCLFSDAYAFFDQGLCYDEEQHVDEAKSMYIKGMQLVERGEKMKNAKKSDIYNDIMAMKKRVQDRLADIDKNGRLDGKRAESFRKSLLELEEKNTSSDAELLYWLPDNVQLVTIDNGTTTAPEPPTSLAILSLSEHQELSKSKEMENKIVPQALIQVGPWAYPLMGAQTMILKNEMGIYVVPNPAPDHPNMCIGIILPRDVDPQLEKDFLKVLRQYATVETSDVVSQMTQEERQRTSDRISQFFIKSGQLLAANVDKLASTTGEYVSEYGNRYRSSMPERQDPAVNVNPALRHGVYFLYRGSKGVAKVTRYLLDKVGDMGIAIGQHVSNSVSGESSGGRLFKSTTTVAAGGITGVSTVWISLENASKTLFNSFANETVETVKVKYGSEAAQTTHHGLHAIGHTTLAGYQLYDLGPRSIAGRMAKKAGIQVLTGGHGSTRSNIKDGNSRPGLPDVIAQQSITDADEKQQEKTPFYPNLKA